MVGVTRWSNSLEDGGLWDELFISSLSHARYAIMSCFVSGPCCFSKRAAPCHTHYSAFV